MKSSTILLAAAALALGSTGAAAQQVIQTPLPHQAQPSAEQEAPPPAPPADGVAAIVEMTDALEFNPPTITVRVGDTVEWRSVGRHAHTVSTDPNRADNPGLIVLPQGVEPFHSGPISTRDAFRYTFRVPGRYVYFCVPHEGDGMIGEVIVME